MQFSLAVTNCLAQIISMDTDRDMDLKLQTSNSELCWNLQIADKLLLIALCLQVE